MSLDRNPQPIFAGSAGCANGREDAAAGRVQLFVARAARAQRELLHPVAGERRMRVAIDEPRHGAPSAAVELLDVAVDRAQLAHAADVGDFAVVDEHVRVLDDVDVARGRLRATARRCRTASRPDAGRG